MFFLVLTELIQQKLSSDTLSILYPELDTIEVKVTIFLMQKMSLSRNSPKIQLLMIPLKIQYFTCQMVDFQSQPAIKREFHKDFILPVILKVE
jgi:hypothetical protein